MTIHAPHDDERAILHDDCPRCAEHAERPLEGLDDLRLRRLVRLALDQQTRVRPVAVGSEITENGRELTNNELNALARVRDEIERARKLLHVAPELMAMQP